MNTLLYNKSKFLMLFLLLLAWLPKPAEAQTQQFEMVVEKTDGTQLPFLITDDYPTLRYGYMDEDGVSSVEIITADGDTLVPCPEIKRLFTRVATTPAVIAGDVDGNGIVEAADVEELKNAILGKPSANYVETNADLNGDDVVNVVDIVLLNIMLGTK